MVWLVFAFLIRCFSLDARRVLQILGELGEVWIEQLEGRQRIHRAVEYLVAAAGFNPLASSHAFGKAGDLLFTRQLQEIFTVAFEREMEVSNPWLGNTQSAVNQYKVYLACFQDNLAGVIIDRQQSIELVKKISRNKAKQFAVEESGLHEAIKNALVRHGVLLMDEVLDLSYEELSLIPHITEESIKEIELWKGLFNL